MKPIRIHRPWQCLRERGRTWPSTSATCTSRIQERRKLHSPAQLTSQFRRFEATTHASCQPRQALEDRLRAVGSIITIDHPANLSDSELLDQFESLNLRDRSDGGQSVVILVTPSFADKALSPSFVKNALGRLFGRQLLNGKSPLNFDVITAVVDKLPRNRSRFWITGENVIARRQASTTPVDSYEGVGYTLVKQLNVEPAARSSSAGRHGGIGTEDSPQTLKVTLQQKPPLTRKPSSQALVANGISQSDPVVSAVTFEVPLADTLFRTGTPQTLHHFQWRIQNDADDPVLLKMEQLESASVLLDVAITDGQIESGWTVDVSAGLVPLTLPQRVHTAMGNVIRELSNLHNPAQIFPASQQLERSVTAYFEATGKPPRAVSVWALVSSESDDGIPDLTERPLESGFEVTQQSDLIKIWTSKQSIWQDRVLPVASRGGRLVKVLSGGGGWGKRAGLLSLDYKTSYADQEVDVLDHVQEDQLVVPAFMSSPEAAKPGELVQFLLAHDELDDACDKDPPGSSHFPTIEFGTIPSTVDSAFAQSLPTIKEPASSGEPAKIHTERGYFGVLSEKGIAVLQEVAGCGKFWTKIDVPDSRVIISITPGTSTREQYIGQAAAKDRTMQMIAEAPGETSGALASGGVNRTDSSIGQTPGRSVHPNQVNTGRPTSSTRSSGLDTATSHALHLPGKRNFSSMSSSQVKEDASSTGMEESYIPMPSQASSNSQYSKSDIKKGVKDGNKNEIGNQDRRPQNRGLRRNQRPRDGEDGEDGEDGVNGIKSAEGSSVVPRKIKGRTFRKIEQRDVPQPKKDEKLQRRKDPTYTIRRVDLSGRLPGSFRFVTMSKGPHEMDGQLSSLSSSVRPPGGTDAGFMPASHSSADNKVLNTTSNGGVVARKVGSKSPEQNRSTDPALSKLADSVAALLKEF